MTSREAEIQARLDAATPGPWGVEAPWLDDTSWVAFLDTEGERGNSGYVVTTESEDAGEEYTEADAHLIANAPADLAYLLARVARVASEAAERAWDECFQAISDAIHSDTDWDVDNPYRADRIASERNAS